MEINLTSKQPLHPIHTGITAFMKATNVGGILFILIWHTYTAILLAMSGIIPEIILPTLIFDYLFLGGCLVLWLLVGKGQRGGLLQWLSYVTAEVFNVLVLIWQIEQFDLFTEYAIYFIPNTVLLWVWLIFLCFSLLYLLLVPFAALIQVLRRKLKPDFSWVKRSRVRGLVPLVVPFLMLSLAFPLATAYVNEGTVKRVVEIEDTNTNASFSIWDFPAISAQIGSSQEINLTALTETQNRTLTAFGKMNTTFYGQISFGTELQANTTIAYLKLLDAFNLTVCATIWYTVDSGFPGPANAANWVAVARSTLEFLIANGITNVIGICSDSESEAECTPSEYWGYVATYDAFLKEVQTNVSLRHPDPARGTFETVLCFDPRALIDLVDGPENDVDIIFGRRNLGMPPFSWTKYHFMLYRLNIHANTAELYNYLLLGKKYLGVDRMAPIVGLTGVEWFAEGYFNGTYDPCGAKILQPYNYDGIDGWAAMKREIFVCKAMGFHSVSVFHLNSYNCPGKIENYGLLDYYGLIKVEELAAEWIQTKIVRYPISGLNFDLKRAGFFNPNGDFIYDLETNLEMYLCRGLISAGVIVWAVYSSSKIAKKRKNPTIKEILHYPPITRVTAQQLEQELDEESRQQEEKEFT